ncbi:hypothetical protein C1E23_03750 [Pseudoalteromonas phenolica]|uniref:Heme NO-binding domain-containing protein n=1 Tax=Pseudoalteromonas phenolica TaxID=161398 RepID=A0A4Q7IRI5_9GAMM|nr:heme NO-binding domain-containing protein [Pseudoalteromonas phenolica]RZQ54415.1 hypothetical protein C1E23_03750 [Pseudoalteromonas phenolica]
MKVSVFNLLQAFLETHHGSKAYGTMLNTLDFPSSIIHLSSTSYNNEISNILTIYREQLNTSTIEMLRTCGKFLFLKLRPITSSGARRIKPFHVFLHIFNNLIRFEIKKLHADSTLPKSDYKQLNSQLLIMIYHLEYWLCHLSEELIFCSAKNFGEEISVYQPKCLHYRDKACPNEVGFI